MLAVLRFTIQPPDQAAFHVEAEGAAQLLSMRPGCRSVRLLRGVEDQTGWLLVSEWEGVGAWRRALSSYDVKAGATALLARAVVEATAYDDVQ